MQCGMLTAHRQPLQPAMWCSVSGAPLYCSPPWHPIVSLASIARQASLSPVCFCPIPASEYPVFTSERGSTWLHLQEAERAPPRHPLWFLSLFWSLSNMLREMHLAERSWLQPTSASSEETKRIWKRPLGASHLTVRNDKPSLSQDLQRHCHQRNQQRTALPNPAHQSETLEF